MERLTDLKDGVLLEVLRHLDVPDLLRCRLVCKRLGELALHRDVWQHMSLDAFKDREALCATMHLAPCLKKLALHHPWHKCKCQSYIMSSCAVAELSISVFFDDDALAVNGVIAMIHNQVLLGRLRCLVVYLRHEVHNIDRVLATLASVSGSLEKLHVILPSWSQSFISMTQSDTNFVQPTNVYSPSLRVFSCLLNVFHEGLVGYESFVDFILTTHAGTLEEVNFEIRRTWTSTSTAFVLASMPNLRCLKCPLLPELQAVAASKSLRSVSLAVKFQTPPLVAAAEAFFGSAEQLRDASLAFDIGTDLDFFTDLVTSSGRSRVEMLRVGAADPRIHAAHVPAVGGGMQYLYQSMHRHEFNRMYAVMLPALIRALPSLSSLTALWVDRALGDVLENVTPDSAPTLQKLLLGPMTDPTKVDLDVPCAHTWLYEYNTRELLQANPSLQVFLNCDPAYSAARHKERCSQCQDGRCDEVWDDKCIRKCLLWGSWWVQLPRDKFCQEIPD